MRKSATHPNHLARLEDPRTGIVEEAGFLGPDGERIFAVRHLPPEPARAGIVMCTPIFAEFEKNYRREVPLARILARGGLAVQRFHYRGTGHSDDGEMTFESMRRDAILAAHSLVERTGITRVALMGTRLGGMIAGSAASEFSGAPVALWDPVVLPADYFRDVMRHRRVLETKKGQRGGPSLTEELAERGVVDAVGYQLRRALFDSLAGRSLAQELGPEPRPLLLVQFGQPQRPLRAEYRALRDDLAARSFPVDTAVASLDEMWLFATHWQPPERLLNVTAAWLQRQLLPAPVTT